MINFQFLNGCYLISHRSNSINYRFLFNLLCLFWQNILQFLFLLSWYCWLFYLWKPLFQNFFDSLRTSFVIKMNFLADAILDRISNFVLVLIRQYSNYLFLIAKVLCTFLVAWALFLSWNEDRRCQGSIAIIKIRFIYFFHCDVNRLFISS